MSITQTELSTTSHLVLVRLLAVGKKPPSPNELAKQLNPFAQHRYSPAEWKEEVKETLQQLEQQELLTSKRVLTPKGREQALDFLGVAELPDNLRWTVLRDRYLVAKALGLAAHDSKSREKVKDADRLRGAVIAKEHDLPGTPVPTINQAVDAFVWKELGFEETKPISRRAIVAAVVSHYFKLPKAMDAFCSLVERINDPHFGVNYDPSNAILAGDNPLELLGLVRHRVLTMHASDRFLIEGHSTISAAKNREALAMPPVCDMARFATGSTTTTPFSAACTKSASMAGSVSRTA